MIPRDKQTKHWAWQQAKRRCTFPESFERQAKTKKRVKICLKRIFLSLSLSLSLSRLVWSKRRKELFLFVSFYFDRQAASLSGKSKYESQIFFCFQSKLVENKFHDIDDWKVEVVIVVAAAAIAFQHAKAAASSSSFARQKMCIAQIN